MAKSNTKFLRFFVRQSPAVTEELLEEANGIIRQCQIKLAEVTDPDTKRKLNNMIHYVSQVLESFPNDWSNNEACSNLQMESLSLPLRLEQNNDLASVSYKIAVACLFILAFSVAISLGYAFHALYFSYFTTQLFVDYLVTALAAVGIPASFIGLFAFGLYAATGEKSKDINELQADVNNFVNHARDAESSHFFDNTAQNDDGEERDEAASSMTLQS